ncbi:MAG: diacylglycerol kinase [Gammaproteobacteria bacterium]|nr:diacylglycerol kinase [Gammaproteobacteria bacterium]
MARLDNPYALNGLPRLWRASRVLVRAMVWGFRREEALRLEMLGLLLLVPLGLYLGDSGVRRALLIAPLFLLLIIELLNTAVEMTVDRIGLEHHELSGLAKDLGSAAVGVTLLWGLVTWALILI